MGLLPSILVVAAGGAIVWGLARMAAALRSAGADAAQARTLQLLTLLAPGVAAAASDPQSLLVWHPVAQTARRLFPENMAAIDRAAGTAFPFSRDQIEQAHARWTADWLAWEQAHDGAFRLKIARAEAEFAASPLLRPTLEAIEREKLELYQAHYGQYVRVAKALQALIASS